MQHLRQLSFLWFTLIAFAALCGEMRCKTFVIFYLSSFLKSFILYSLIVLCVCVLLFIVWLLCPRPRRGGGGIRWSSASVVRLSDVAYIGSNSKTKRPLGRRNFAQGYPRSHATPTLTSRSKVKVGRGHIVAASWWNKVCINLSVF